MSHEPEYRDWQQIVELIRSSVDSQQHEMLLTMLMTPDERESLTARVNILNELLKGELSQRQISQMLGVGIATITRGSNELKSKSEVEKDKLKLLLEQVCTVLNKVDTFPT
ncbi:trp operon repressor [Vibrio parahaemolyticus]|uniref:trp operon repressor n=5 Tax=Vibrio TaxID=662 RepID=UPI00320ECFA8